MAYSLAWHADKSSDSSGPNGGRMRKALFILGQLNDDDVEWLAHNGERRRLGAGEVIVREGEPLNALFITLNGRLVVTLSDGKEVARLGVGEVVGEIAF